MSNPGERGISPESRDVSFTDVDRLNVARGALALTKIHRSIPNTRRYVIERAQKLGATEGESGQLALLWGLSSMPESERRILLREACAAFLRDERTPREMDALARLYAPNPDSVALILERDITTYQEELKQRRLQRGT